MSHFTLVSGVRTVSVTLVCPACRRRRLLARQESTELESRSWVPPAQLYCDAACQTTHTDALVLDAARVAPIFSFTSRVALATLQLGFLPHEIACKLQGVTP